MDARIKQRLNRDYFDKTHIEVRRLVNYLKAGGSVTTFLQRFPSVKRKCVDSALDRMTEFWRLVRENVRQRSEIAILQESRRTPSFMRGESLVASWVNGKHTEDDGPYDVVAEDGSRLEVKCSQLSMPYQGATTKRWSWQKILGEQGGKRFDRLILIGKKDRRYAEKYGDKDCPWIIFDVPYRRVNSLALPCGNRWLQIQLTTNPATACSKGSKLFRYYQVTMAEMVKRYRKRSRTRC
jgi:hypothetical protein